jgi:hypothetical protein
MTALGVRPFGFLARGAFLHHVDRQARDIFQARDRGM